MAGRKRFNSIVSEPIGHYNAISFEHTNYSGLKRLDPIVKWPGGKESELKYIIRGLPTTFKRYFEPFVGGGSVYAAIQADEYFINDKSIELIDLYRVLESNQKTTFIDLLAAFDSHWEALSKLTKTLAIDYIQEYKRLSSKESTEEDFQDFSRSLVRRITSRLEPQIRQICPDHSEDVSAEVRRNVLRKAFRLIDIETDRKKISDMDVMRTLETSIKGSYYMLIRHLYNKTGIADYALPLRSALFFFIRNFTYSGMFRYNASGEFNVPYGGMAYNSKSFEKKIAYFLSPDLEAKLSKTKSDSLDFEEFLTANSPGQDDFVFLDPPYDSEFSTYAQNQFTRQDHERLASLMIHQCSAKWMMIIKRTPFIEKLYKHSSLRIESFEKKYLVSFMNRNDKAAEHLIISNY